MPDWLVEKKYDPNRSRWYLQEYSYGDLQEATLLAENQAPGKDFVKITGEGTPEGARSQAKDYFNGTLEDPGVIDAWVQSLEERRGTTYYVVRTKGGEYPPGLEDEDASRLVAFTDHDQAMKRAQRETARTGEDTNVDHMQPYAVRGVARRQGFEYILIVHRDGGREVELVDEDE